MTVTKGQILASLPKLSHAELQEISAVIGHLLTAGAAVPIDEANPQVALSFDALSAALKLTAPLSSLPPALAVKLAKQADPLWVFSHQHFEGWDDNKLKQIAFLRLMFKLLKDDLTRIGIKPTYTTMVHNMHRMPEVFDSAYPGYRDAGLAYIILNRLIK